MNPSASTHGRHAHAKGEGCCSKAALLAKDVMTRDPISVTSDIPARELARILADNQISGAPVVDQQDRVVGVVSRTDLLQWCVTGGLGLGAGDLLPTLAGGRAARGSRPDDLGIVEDFMTEDAITCTTDTPVAVIAKRMAEERVHRVIVLDDDGCLEGVVTSLDVLKVFPA